MTEYKGNPTQPQTGYPPHQGYPPSGQPGYPPSGQPGYPPPGQPGYPPPGQPGYPQPGQPGYPQPGQPGYPPPGQPGYLPSGHMGYPASGQMGYSHSEQPVSMQPVAGQPAGAGWMPIPQVPRDCPRGLEYMMMIDQLLVQQKVELLEAFTGFESANKYTVKNSMGQKVYYAAEDSDCLTRQCCGPLRPFDLKILDNFGNEVIHLNRPLKCDSCWCPCCLQVLEVTAPPGTPIGTIEQEWSILSPSFSIKNAAGDTVLKIEGPICTWSICGDVEFKVLSKNGDVQVGKISKQWTGILKESFTDADNFGITFPMDLDVKMKAVMLGAVFLIDFMFFEKAGNKESDGVGMF